MFFSLISYDFCTNGMCYCSSKPMSSSGPSNGDRICLGTTVAAHVAHTQETVRLKDPHGVSTLCWASSSLGNITVMRHGSVLFVFYVSAGKMKFYGCMLQQSSNGISYTSVDGKRQLRKSCFPSNEKSIDMLV